MSDSQSTFFRAGVIPFLCPEVWVSHESQFCSDPLSSAASLLKCTCWAGEIHFPSHNPWNHITPPNLAPSLWLVASPLFLQSATGVIRFKNASDSFGLSRHQVGVCAAKEWRPCEWQLARHSVECSLLHFPLLSVKSLGVFHNIYPSAWASFYFKLRRVGSWISSRDVDISRRGG